MKSTKIYVRLTKSYNSCTLKLSRVRQTLSISGKPQPPYSGAGAGGKRYMNREQERVVEHLSKSGGKSTLDKLVADVGKVSFLHIATLREAGIIDYHVEFHDGKPVVMLEVTA